MPDPAAPRPIPAVLDDSLILPNLLRTRAARTPHHVFSRDVNGDERDYATMLENTLAYASYFQEQGVERDEIVATFLPASHAALEIWMGITWAGGIEAALNRAYRHQLLADVLNDTTARVVVTTQDFLPTLAEVSGNLEHIQRIILIDAHEQVRSPVEGWVCVPAADAHHHPHDEDALVRPSLESTACILYTSGTTGPSKGVVMPWAQLLETGRTIVPTEHMDETDVFYSPYAPCHITGKAYFYSMMLLGGGYVLRPQFKTSEFWSDIRRFGATSTLLQGAMAHFLWNAPETEDDAITSLSKVIIAPVIAEVEAFEERFGVAVGTVYNMTELSCPLMSDGWVNDGRGSCGTPRPGVTARLVDEFDREVSAGDVGELVVRHDDPWTMTTGYLGRAEATVTATRNQWFHTGDTFYQDAEGRYFFVDRKKDSIRRRGENISSAEIEREVRQYPGVREVAAIAAPSEFGEDEVRLIVVPEGADVVHPEQLFDFLKSRLAGYMLPYYIDLVETIPKTETQKVQKNLLRGLPISDSTWRRPARLPQQ
ncbi:AMP-binding protein [Microbacterium schleiferi]|uniref:AMP-binding protein n=1 Tax=Microbacterium schleiferi TaxID=69362 RepID=A0A7S8MYI9_9MICO|nr:AMP-binding protein [Microbacterium schleiferi]QPE05589.1 AMP-binding protein [Microbacterium schleiferi]